LDPIEEFTREMMKVSRNGILLLLGIFGFTCHIEAQDDHYWSQQYGALSTLMGGAMVGGVSDNSAVFYNPAALSFINNPGLSIDANVYKMDKILISDGAGEGMNLNSAQLSVYPQIISGMVNLLKNDRFRISYTMLTRNHNNLLMNTRYTGNTDQGNTDKQMPAATSYAGAFDYINQLNEQWFGIGMGYKISEKLGIGASVFTSYRGQTYQLTNYVREVKNVDSNYVYSTRTNDEAIKYYTFSLLGKVGLTYFTEPWKFGLTITTPSIGLYGKGSIQRENSNIVVSEIPVDVAGNFIIMDSKNDVKAVYRHPLSIAAGIDYQSSGTRLAISAEYFFRINSYHLIEPESEPFVYPPFLSESENIKAEIDAYLHIENAAKPVFNIAIGFSQIIYRQLSLLLGVSTDFTNYDITDESNELLHGFGGSDIYHFSSGISYQRKKSSLCLGFSYAMSPDRQVPPYTFINQTPDFTSNALLSAHMYTVVLGYTYYLSKFSE
jgi:hypothetical protein